MYSHLSDNIREQQKLDKTIKIVSDVYLAMAAYTNESQ